LGQSVIVAVNKFGFDTDNELQILKEHCALKGCAMAVNDGFAKGGRGAVELAQKVVEIV